MKSILHISVLIFLGLDLIFAFESCSKDTRTLPVVTTAKVTSVTRTNAVAGGNVADNGGAAIVSRGVCWNTSEHPTIDNTRTIEGGETGSFTCKLESLTPDTKYYVRAYAINEVGTAYGKEISFRTDALAGAVITTVPVTSITSTTVVSGGNILSDGGSLVTARGVCWGTADNPTINCSKTSDGSGAGIFTSNITGLQPGVSYYIRAYAVNEAGTSYGDEIYFSTFAMLPVLATTSVSLITSNSAASGGNITSDCGSAIISRGVCWSIHSAPTTGDQKTYDGTGTGGFVSSITGLQRNMKYYIRAWATNIIGTSYGNELTFTTLPELPSVITTGVTGITCHGATSGGMVTSDGGAPLTAKGICWSTLINPTISDNRTADGTLDGLFVSSMTGLLPNTTYYVRAYATNSAGTSYGQVLPFATPPVTIPVLTTVGITLIGRTSAASGGEISSDGGEPVTERGVCWAVAVDPTIDNYRTSDGAGAGNYISNLTGLLPGITYHVRAYATNVAGTSYGSTLIFTTLPDINPILFNPVLTYGLVSDIDGNIYKTIQIGTQTWMAENLKTTKYSDGIAIPLVAGGSYLWWTLTTPGYCWYNNDEPTFKSVYGSLYNWYAVNTGLLCPSGWHVPSDQEWTLLTDFLGGESIAAGKIRETGITHWISPNEGTTNESGFTALPGGYRDSNGDTPSNPVALFWSNTMAGYWWTSTPDNNLFSFSRDISSGGTLVSKRSFSVRAGFSVRCLKD